MPSAIKSPYSDNQTFKTEEMSVVSQKDGFFYLDLIEGKNEELWETYEKCLAVVVAWFEKPLRQKAEYAFKSDVNGCKYLVSQAGPLENTKDGFGTLRISPSALTSATTAQDMPQTILDNAAIMADFMNMSKFHVRVLLSAFSDAQGLKEESRYEVFHKG